MTFDLQAHLARQRVDPAASSAWDLVGQLSDECLSWSCKDSRSRARAQQRYQQCATRPTLTLPAGLCLHLRDAPAPLLPGWLWIHIRFELKTPWYSKDDRPLHVLDNPVRKDRVFGVPFMSASSWKGLLRWICRMESGLLNHLATHDGRIDGWEEPSWIVHLFGNPKGADEHFSRGALQCYPTWFCKVGFEVINPHDRARRAGTQPITYEVVPAGCQGDLHLLYAPTPRQAERQGVDSVDVLGRLLDAANRLLTIYGFSAKRTAGWGLAEVPEAGIRSKDGSKNGHIDDLKAALPALLGTAGGPA